MYVKRLIEFAEEHPQLFPPLGFQNKKIDWIVDIDGGHLIFNEAEKQERTVPTLARSGSGAAPTLLVDKADYVFGWASSTKEQKRSKERHISYMRLLRKYSEETEDQDIQTLLQALEGEIDFPEKLKTNDFIVFRIRSQEFLHTKESVKTFWSHTVQPKASKNSIILPCMFCGESSLAMERHSINFVVSGERTKMISANKNAYESHNNKYSYVAPTCYVCEQKYGQALDYLLQREPNTNNGKHMFSVGDLTYVYWLRGKSSHANLASAFSYLNDANLDEMKNQLKQVFGGQVEQSNFKDFCLLVLSANKGRLVVRDYIEDSMGNIHNRITRFIEAQYVGRERLYGVYTLAGTIYQKANTQIKKIDVQDWFNWIFQGKPLPGRILITLIKRIQAEGAMYATHAAVLKSWLVSKNEGREWTVETDQTNTKPEYVLGRIFAVLEKIHGEAINSNSKGTLSSRFFGSASTTPKSVMGMLIRNAQYHLAKIEDRNKGRAVNLDKSLGELLQMIKIFPATLMLSEQAEFALGYYHEKENLWTKKEDNNVKTTE